MDKRDLKNSKRNRMIKLFAVVAFITLSVIAVIYNSLFAAFFLSISLGDTI